MKAHTKEYYKAFGHTPGDWIGCEVCQTTAVDIHHIQARGMGGTAKADTKENLMALCRACHIEYGDKKQYIEFLVETHLKIC